MTSDSEGCCPQSACFTTTPRPSTFQAKSPEYIIYTYKDVDLAIKAGSITVELRHRFIKGTTHNMVAMVFNPPLKRMPSTNELVEKAISLVLTYPLLNDTETKHVS